MGKERYQGRSSRKASQLSSFGFLNRFSQQLLDYQDNQYYSNLNNMKNLGISQFLSPGGDGGNFFFFFFCGGEKGRGNHILSRKSEKKSVANRV